MDFTKADLLLSGYTEAEADAVFADLARMEAAGIDLAAEERAVERAELAVS